MEEVLHNFVVCLFSALVYFPLLTGQLQLEDDLIASRSEMAKVQSNLSKEQEKVSILQHQVDELLSKHAEDVTVRDDFIKQLNIELDSKANVIVLLTQQIYRIRAKLKQELEDKTTKALICSCPHCYIHSEISESKEQQGSLTSRENKLAPLRKANCHHHSYRSPPSIHNTEDQHSLASTSSVVSENQTRHLTPTPPLCPPPTSASGWRRGIVRRASTPVRKNSSSPTDIQTRIPSHSQIGIFQDDHTHCIHRRHAQRLVRDRVGGCAGGGRGIPSQDDLQQQLSFEGGNRVTCNRYIRKDGPAVLPPIASLDAEQLEEQDPGNDGVILRSHHQDLDVLADCSILQHRHMASYTNSLSLSSAPPGSLRLLHRASRSKGQGQLSGGVVSEESPGCSAEGTLLVKENKQKVSSTAACWVKGTPALD